MSPAVLGVDLAGSERRPTGLCLLRGLKVELGIAWTDREIVEAAVKGAADLIAIDAPLSLPRGRRSLEEHSPHHLRECDRELLKRRIKFFPVTLGPMRKLTARGMRLKAELESLGFKVIEVYPGGAQDVLGIPRKSEGKDKLYEGLAKLGLEGLKPDASDHELDAVTAAIVGALYLLGLHEDYGDPKEGIIVMPKQGLTSELLASKLRTLA
ncbi:MAG: DUF429 domain-containing protein [Thermoprotei archaeon]|nr:MAG: DUF429 domain-containing protein [Thermoprotei archaeon]